MRFVIFAFIAAAICTSVAAQTHPCHSFEVDTVARLACYDENTGFRVEVDQSGFTDDASGSDWILEEQTDLVRGAITSYVFLEADQREFRDSPQALFLRCDGEGSFEVVVSTTGFIGSSDRIQVTYRWNDDEPVSERWNSSTNGKAAFLPRGYRDFMSGLEAGGRLAFEWLDYRGGSSAAVWENVVLDDSARYILGGCEG